jgi:hypothetical protein
MTAPPPVVRGPRPPGTTTLAELSTAETFEARLSAVTSEGLNRRESALALLHRGLFVLRTALLAPWAQEGLHLDVDPDDVGLVLVLEEVDVEAVWLGRTTVVCPASPKELGRRLRQLLDPLMDVAGQLGPVGGRALEVVVLDSVTGACRRLDPRSGPGDTPGWMPELLAGLGLRSRLPQRWMTVAADDGPDVRLAVPRICCVTAVRPTAGSCPTCPLRSTDERRTATERYLAELDDDTFAELVGRARHQCAPQANRI